jgi:hypothetical protein
MVIGFWVLDVREPLSNDFGLIPQINLGACTCTIKELLYRLELNNLDQYLILPGKSAKCRLKVRYGSYID